METTPAPDAGRYWLDVLRLAAGMVVTFAFLIYSWGRTLLEGMVREGPPVTYVVMTIAGVLVVMGLTAGLSQRLRSPRIDRFVTRGLPAIWFGVNVLLISLFTGSLLPRALTAPLFALATMWVVWCGWMLYRPLRWTRRLGGLLACFVFTAAFVGLLRVDGVRGEFQVDFTWRARPVADHGAELPVAIAEPSDGLADLSQTTADDFPQFLGPDRTGVIADARLSADWDRTPPREVWRKPVGAGWGSFAVVGDFAVTQEQRGSQECVVCYRVSGGQPVWVHADEVRFDKNMGGPGPRATPTIVDGRVYTVGGTGLLNCLDGRNGRAIWSADILEDNGGGPIEHGVCASPLVTNDRVIVAPTGILGACLAAYDRESGKKIWRGGRRRASYGSPALVNLAGTRQIVIATAEGIEGSDFESGKPLWEYVWHGDHNVNCSQPVVVDAAAGRVFFAVGYGKGGVLLHVDHPSAGEWSVTPLWTSREMKTKFTTAVIYENHLYGLDDGILACLDLATGKRLWKAGRYQHGQVLLAGDLLIVQAESGEVYLVRPDPKKLIELGKIAALAHKTWNNPALSGRRLLVRDDQEAVCYELPIRARSQSN